ncbi:MAG: transcriptional repressor NrdR [Gemmatales bacterium]|nr:MAG: transcriptional repressor NrdR [Gemmatales bacterium]
MKCPFCRKGDFAVVDSRSQDGGFPRRRRACDHCKRKVWTVEQIVETPLQVIKKDGTREPFDAGKIRGGLEKACYKRPISAEQIEAAVAEILEEVYSRYFGEVPAQALGDMVMARLKTLDQVAYVRFASIYREFKDVSEFVQEVQPMLKQSRNGTGNASKKRKRAKKAD